MAKRVRRDHGPAGAAGGAARLAVVLFLLLAPLGAACAREPPVTAAGGGGNGADPFVGRRVEMVRTQIHARGIETPSVLRAMEAVPRHLFVPERERGAAYEDHPLPIGYDQTISQPYIVALMTDLLDLDGNEKVLEIGTGCGYQAAVLAELADRVFSIEIVEPLAETARARLAELGYDNVQVRAGDGYRGWPEEAPFDAIILTAAPPEIPQPLIDQLALGGILAAPIGDENQELVLFERTPSGLTRREVAAVRFVPMTGKAQERP